MCRIRKACDKWYYLFKDQEIMDETKKVLEIKIDEWIQSYSKLSI
jgi:hypothetical protein